MSKLAKQLIEKELREKTGILDLGNCGLADLETEVPELFECTHLEWLNLGSKFLDPKDISWKESPNQSGDNSLENLPEALGKLVNLKYLCAFKNEIKDVEVLSELVNLQNLLLNHNEIGDLTPLRFLKQLVVADFGDNKIVSLEGLENQKNLRILSIGNNSLGNNGISDIGPIAESTGLYWLYLNGNTIRDISILSSFKELMILDLAGNEVEEVKCLENIVGLVNLNLSGNPISDLSPLKSLNKLKRLEILCSSVDDLSGISGLSDLKYLKVGKVDGSGGGFVTFTNWKEPHPTRGTWKPLAALSGLIELDLYCSPEDDLSPLSNLHNLESLHVSGGWLGQPFETGKLDFMHQLKGLKSITLFGIELDNLDFLRNCSQLEHILIQYNKDLSSIKWTRGLSELKSLHIHSGQIRSLESIEELNKLESLSITGNKLTDIAPLGGLPKLEWLSLRSNQIQDIRPLSALRKLEHLDISNNQVNDLAPLADLKQMRVLDVTGNQVTDIRPLLFLLAQVSKYEMRYTFDEIPWGDFNMDMSQFKGVFLGKNPIQYPPLEIVEMGRQAVVDYFAELEKGSQSFYESKLILVGNGRVGKTSLVRRLLDGTFDENEPSTHAIQLRQVGWKDLFGHSIDKTLQLNIWDFGGQDIYHATHRVFMKTKALFLVLWDAGSESVGNQSSDENGEEHFPVSYWLSHVESQGEGSPAMLIQSKKDLHNEQTPSGYERLRQKFPDILRERAAISSKTGKGIADLKEKLADQIRRHMEEHRQTLPESWIRLKKALESFREQGRTDIRWEEYRESAEKAGVEAERIHTPVKYLHHSGFLFYAEGLFQDRVILDQKWAIQNVYALFDRKGKFFRLFQRNGFFRGEHLQEIWADKSTEECELLASFMESCFVCSEWHPSQSRLPFPDREFLAPQLLPTGKVPNQDDLFEEGNSFFLRQRYEFLHPGVIQRLIIKLSRLAKKENVRKNRILLRSENGLALLEAFPESREIITRFRAHSNKDFLKEVLTAIKEVNKTEDKWTHWLSRNGKDYIQVKDLGSPVEQVQSEKGAWLDKEVFEPVGPLLKEVFSVPWQPGNQPFEDDFSEVEELIQKSRLEEGMDKAKSLCRFRGLEAYRHELILLQSRISELQKKERMGTELPGQLNVFWNQIRVDLLDTLEKMKEEWVTSSLKSATS